MKEPQKTRKRALPQPTGTSKSSDGEVEASWVSEEWGAPGFLGNKGVGWGPIEGSGRRSFRRRGKGVERAGRSARGSRGERERSAGVRRWRWEVTGPVPAARGRRRRRAHAVRRRYCARSTGAAH